MTYPRPFLRLVVNGTLANNREQFSFGCSFIGATDGGMGSAPSEVPPEIVTATAVLFNLSTGVVDGGVYLTNLKLNLIGTDGRYVDQSDTVQHDYAEPVGSNGMPDYPPQIATVVTLRTGARRGLASRGRFYLPPPSFNVEGGGVLSEVSAATIRDRVATWLQACEAALPGFDLGVVSNVREGAERRVTGIDVGRALDTMRSRRTKVPENYVGPTDYSPDVDDAPEG